MAGARQARLDARRRQARVVGALGFALAACLPVILFHRVVKILMAADPAWEVHYLSGWTPWLLLAAGLLFLLPVAWSAGLNPDSRWFPRSRGAYAGWGISLYVLGFLLAWQVAAVQGAHFTGT
jgi:hypothetical protein